MILAWLAAALVLLPSLVWAVGIARWARDSRRRRRSSEDLPSVSVIVAGRDEESHIADCLQSLLAVDYPSDRIEFCFVDDHSEDRTRAIAEQIAETDSRLQVLSAPDEPVEMGSKKRALACGISRTHGTLLLFTDADNRVPTTWIRGMVRCFDRRTGAVIGPAMPASVAGSGVLYRLERFLVNLTSASAIGYGVPGTACGQNLAIRREALEQIGGHAHPEWPSGDDDLTVQALARSGWRIRFAEGRDALVRDDRHPSVRQHVDASSRHQSTVRFYPLRWRLLYALTVLSGVLLFGLAVGAIVSGSAVIAPLILALCGKWLVDGLASWLFARRTGIRFGVGDLLTSEILLPIYTLLRPLLLLRGGHRWRGIAYAQTGAPLTRSGA